MLTVATCFWNHNKITFPNSRCGYDESWVEKLYRGFKRNLTQPFRFVCFSERDRVYSEPAIEKERLRQAVPNYGANVDVYRLNEPMITCGLDTVIVGNIDHMAEYCLTAKDIALPKHPYEAEACCGIELVPAGHRFVYDEYDGNPLDMDYKRTKPHVFIDALWPGEVVSFKAHVRGRPFPEKARVVYFHGRPKMGDVLHEPFVKEHWR